MQLAFWREGTREQRQLIANAVNGAHDRAQKNRALLLRHPDLVDRFVRELGYDHIGQWNGYCPPSRATTGAGYVFNTSTRREIIFGILSEAADRELTTSDAESALDQ